MTARRSEAEQDWFHGEGDAEAGLDGGGDLVAEGEDFGGGGSALVGQGEGVAGGDAGVAEGEAFGEAGLLDEPGGGELDAGSGADAWGGPVGDPGGFDPEGAGEVFKDADEDDGVLEEGPGAAGFGVFRGAGVEEHAFGPADVADSVIELERGGVGSGKALLEVGVGEVRPGVGRETEGDGGDDVATAGGGVEEARPVVEAAVPVGEVGEGAGVEVEGADGGDGFGDLLAVGADVLDGRAAG